MVAVADVAVVAVVLAFACTVASALSYQLGYAHGRLREIDGGDGGPRFEEIDRADEEFTPGWATTKGRP